jgi:hypothetical protein
MLAILEGTGAAHAWEGSTSWLVASDDTLFLGHLRSLLLCWFASAHTTMTIETRHSFTKSQQEREWSFLEVSRYRL